MSNQVLKILASAALVTWTVPGCGHPGHDGIAPPKVSFSKQGESIPFELFRGNRIVVDGRVNGHSTQLMLDTGASATTLDTAYARSIGLPPGQKIKAKGAGGIIEAEIVPGVTLDLGGMRFENMTVGVMDLAPITRAIGRPLNVILGREFFNSTVVSIDWSTNRLRVNSREAFTPDARATAVQLTRKGPFNTIPVSIAGAPPIEALLDLGNGGALSLPPSYWGGRSELTGLKYAESRTGGVGGLHGARAALIPEVMLAGTTFRNVPAALSEAGNDRDAEKMANVGIGLMKQFHVDLDLGRDRIYLRPRADAPAFDRDRAGTMLELLGDRLKVRFVSSQGPAAAAGLKEGDEIVAVDGKRVTTAYYNGADWARGPAGRNVKLERADGTTVTVTLRDYY
jgi:hypothetical protein